MQPSSPAPRGLSSGVPPKSPTDADRFIGNRIRARRVLIGMSQERLGEILGVTFQQVQKYERGVNRIGAARLQDIAAALGVPITYFYEQTGGDGAQSSGMSGDLISLVLGSPEAIRLFRAFAAIRDDRVRHHVVSLVEALSKTRKG